MFYLLIYATSVYYLLAYILPLKLWKWLLLVLSLLLLFQEKTRASVSDSEASFSGSDTESDSVLESVSDDEFLKTVDTRAKSAYSSMSYLSFFSV